MTGQTIHQAHWLARAVAFLLRDTTWKCGRVEQLAVNHLRTQLQRRGRSQTPVKDILEHFELDGKQRNEFLDALKRLEKRRIIKIEGF